MKWPSLLRFESAKTLAGLELVRQQKRLGNTDLEENWWRTIQFLTLVGRSGIVLNPSKFQFAQRSVDFAGFRISESCVEPLPKYLNAIQQFPTPKNIKDIRSWFGLLNQVANYVKFET